MSEPHLILGIGELLWDILPEKALLGGAPANFAVMAGQLGNHAAILSCIGRDDAGRNAIETLRPMPVDINVIDIDPAHETGRVTVSFAGNEPSYTIHKPVAWDFMQALPSWVRLAERAGALCFGSLAQRSPQSRQTIQTLVAQAPFECIRIFDVNLRAPYYSGEVIQESLELATVIKMNKEEAPLVMRLLGMEELLAKDSLLRSAERLLDEFPTLEMVAVTRGERGSLLVTRGEWNDHKGIPVKVADAIGAGDAFAAALAHYMLRGADLATLNEAGNRWGSWVASQEGAMPVLTDAVRKAIEASIDASN